MNKQELINFLSDNTQNEALFKKADEVRKAYVGDEVHLRALIEFSNICKCDCKYCGLQISNKNIERYSLTKDEILASVNEAVKLGYKTVVLQSGESSNYSTDEMCEIIREIKKYDIALTLSIGEKSFEEYKEYKKNGADRYLLRIETTDQNLYKKMHPKSDFNNRVKCLENLKTLGYELGTGCLVGLPEQTIESLANDILFFKEIQADMIGIGPFIPHEDTPLKDAKMGDYWLALKVMALTRILLKDINIPATTAMETIYPQGRIIALNSGANVVMPNITIEKYRENYDIYPNKNNAFTTRNEIEEILASIGRCVSQTQGFRKK